MDCEKPFTKNPSPFSKRSNPFSKASSPYSPKANPFTAAADVYSCYKVRLLLLEDGTNLLLESGVTIAI
jgi:hypothetical protein